jgi:hypothetical protein
MNPLDWGNSPFSNGAVRGFFAALITGILYALYEMQKGVAWEQAVVAGAIPMLLAFLSLLGFGAVDQNRANQNIINASDVPVAATAKIQGQSPQMVADQWNAGPIVVGDRGRR